MFVGGQPASRILRDWRIVLRLCGTTLCCGRVNDIYVHVRIAGVVIALPACRRTLFLGELTAGAYRSPF